MKHMKNSPKLLNPKNINDADYIVTTEGIDGLKESFRRYHCFCKDPEKLEQLVEKDMAWYRGQQNKEFKNMQYGFPKGFRMWKLLLTIVVVLLGLYFLLLSGGVFL